jgi:hypothetical protein
LINSEHTGKFFYTFATRLIISVLWLIFCLGCSIFLIVVGNASHPFGGEQDEYFADLATGVLFTILPWLAAAGNFHNINK